MGWGAPALAATTHADRAPAASTPAKSGDLRQCHSTVQPYPPLRGCGTNHSRAVRSVVLVREQRPGFRTLSSDRLPCHGLDPGSALADPCSDTRARQAQAAWPAGWPDTRPTPSRRRWRSLSTRAATNTALRRAHRPRTLLIARTMDEPKPVPSQPLYRPERDDRDVGNDCACIGISRIPRTSVSALPSAKRQRRCLVHFARPSRRGLTLASSSDYAIAPAGACSACRRLLVGEIQRFASFESGLQQPVPAYLRRRASS